MKRIPAPPVQALGPLLGACINLFERCAVLGTVTPRICPDKNLGISPNLEHR